MHFSASMEYAVHSLIYLTGKPPKESILIKRVAAATGVPEAYLRKVFQSLTRNGILNSKRGANGGFYLAGNPEEITLRHIAEAIDGTLALYGCLSHKRGCRLEKDCIVIKAFSQAQTKMLEILESYNLADLAQFLGRHRRQAAWLN